MESTFLESYNDENSQVTTSNFGFKSQATPPQNKHLNAIEVDMYEMIRSIEFRNLSDEFKKQLAADITKIKETISLTIPADKTTNFYSISVEDYEKLLTENISSTYKKCEGKIVKNINNAKSSKKAIKQ